MPLFTPMPVPVQLSLDLPFLPQFGRAHFSVSSANSAALAMVDLWPHWPDSALLVSGPPGSGKSHLAHIWAQAARAMVIPASSLAEGSLPSLHQRQALVVEDADRIGAGEAQLFHLLNLLRECNGWVMLTAANPPDHWDVALPDLLSRLRQAPAITIKAPDDALVRDVLAKNFADRQLAVDPGVVDYIVMRMERSFFAARLLTVRMDAEALARGTAVTKGVAAVVLGQVYGHDDLFQAE